MQKLSVTLAARNESQNLDRCLSSVKPLADEIIVFNDNSTDDTVIKAKKYGAVVFSTPHYDNFHKVKVKANAKAKNNWVLQMDADESLTPELQKEIESLLAGKAFGYDAWVSPLKQKIFGQHSRPLTEPAAAYYLPRKNFFLGRYLKHTGQYPDPVIRLFQKEKAYLPAQNVHEQMVVEGAVGWLKGDLDHYATPEFSRYLLRENRYSSLSANEWSAQKIKINPLTFFKYFIYLPTYTFCSLYFRYFGFLDGFSGFVFSLFSGIHFQLSYLKLWELYKKV